LAIAGSLYARIVKEFSMKKSTALFFTLALSTAGAAVAWQQMAAKLSPPFAHAVRE